jgi:hypothetical protein
MEMLAFTDDCTSPVLMSPKYMALLQARDFPGCDDVNER